MGSPVSTAAVAWALDGGVPVGELAIGQRAALVRALVPEREQPLLDVGHGDAAGGCVERAHLAVGDLCQRTNADEVHDRSLLVRRSLPTLPEASR
jgi:hypothetical protein